MLESIGLTSRLGKASSGGKRDSELLGGRHVVGLGGLLVRAGSD